MKKYHFHVSRNGKSYGEFAEFLIQTAINSHEINDRAND